MIAPVPKTVLTLLTAELKAELPSPRPRTAADVTSTHGETMYALISAGKAQGLSNDFIADSLDRRIRRYLETVGHRGEGERNATAYRVARWLSNDFGASDDVGFAYLSEWNAGNAPPLSDRELQLTWRSAKKSGRRTYGCAHDPRGSAA